MKHTPRGVFDLNLRTLIIQNNISYLYLKNKSYPRLENNINKKYIINCNYYFHKIK